MADQREGDSYEIRQEIERTRIEMHETIDAIQQKLNPERLKRQAGDTIREATIGRAEHTMSNAMDKAEGAVNNVRDTAMEAKSGLMETVRHNPLPAAMIGLGLGWLLMRRSSQERPPRAYYGGSSPYSGATPGYRYGATRPSPTTQASFSHQGHFHAGPSLEENRGTQQEGGLGEVAGKVGEKAGEAREAAAAMMEEVRMKSGDLMGGAGETVGRTGSNLLDTIRENPLPAAMAGIGLSWLFMNGGSSRESSYPGHLYQGNTELYKPHFQGDQSTIGSLRDKVGDTAGQAQNAVGDIAGKAQSTVGDMADRAQSTVGDLAGQAQSTVGEVSDQVQQRVGSMARETKYRYSRVEDRFHETLESNPMAVGAAAMAVGAVAALMLPSTPQEHRLMGEARDSLVEQVQSTAKETMDKVQRVADKVQDSAKQEAQQEGLTH